MATLKLATGEELYHTIEIGYKQCCGSASAWIHMIMVSWIRIRNPHADSKFGCGSGLSYVKISAKILLLIRSSIFCDKN
jgi:hypothetical protein